MFIKPHIVVRLFGRICSLEHKDFSSNVNYYLLNNIPSSPPEVGTESRISSMLGKYSATEICPQPRYCILRICYCKLFASITASCDQSFSYSSQPVYVELVTLCIYRVLRRNPRGLQLYLSSEHPSPLAPSLLESFLYLFHAHKIRKVRNWCPVTEISLMHRISAFHFPGH